VTKLRENHSLSDKLATACEWLLIAAFVIFFSALALTKHRAFQTHGFDLGNYDQTVWNTLHGRPLVCTNWPPFGESRLAFHVEPILLLIAPLYLIHAGSETLLVLQAAVVGLGAWPVARIARRRLGSPWGGPLFAALYLLFPALEAGPVFEFHAVTLASTFLALALYSIETERYRSFVLWAVLASGCKEEISLLVAMMGLYLILKRRRYKLGAATTLLAAAWFLACVQIILPHFNAGGESAHLGRYAYLGDSMPDIAVNVLRRPSLVWDTLREPSRMAYLWRIPFPVGYLALLAPEILILAAPTVAINVLSMFRLMHVLDFVHYSVPLAPFVVIAAVYGSERLLNLTRKLLPNVKHGFLLLVLGGYLLFTSTFYHRVFGHTPLASAFHWPQVTEHHRIGHEILNEIPPQATVSAQMSLNPHLSQRPRIFVFPQLGDAEYIALDVLANRDNEFSLTPPSPKGQNQPRYYNPALPHAQYLRLVRGLLDSADWGIVQARDGFLVLKQGAAGGELGQKFYEPFLGCEEDEASSIKVHFGAALDLRGLALEPDLWTGYTLHTCWQGGPLVTADVHIYIALVDLSSAPGRVIKMQELTASSLVPLSVWRSGQQIHDRAFVLFPSDSEEYALCLLVGAEGASERAAQRWPITVETSRDTIRADDAARVLLFSPDK